MNTPATTYILTTGGWADKADDVIRAPGGGFLSRRTGHFIISEWQLCAVGRGKIRLVYMGPPLENNQLEGFLI